MKSEELHKLTAYLRRVFGNASLEVRARPRKTDSAEVYAGEEFLGVVYRDDEDGEDDVSYNFSMAILDIDLDG